MRRRSALFFPAIAVLTACATAPSTPADEPAPAVAPAAPTGSTAAPPPAPAAPVRKTGALLFATGAPIAGLAFGGGTTDAQGTFTYEEGKPVTFRVGDVVLGSVAGAAVLSPYQLASSGACDDTAALVRVVRLLEALDGDPAPGVTITKPAGTGAAKDLANATDAELEALAGKPLPDATTALRAFLTSFDGEAWTETSKDTFDLLNAALRGQGVATDGTSWFFSGTTGLEKTDASFGRVASNALAIPLGLVIAGSDHIGDIDVWSGTIYAPVEDKGYKAPKVVLYDPSSLTSGQVFDVPWDLQTKGVPWIAVDGPRKVAYMAEWDPAPVLHVFDLATMVWQRDIPLSRTLSRIQGAKVHKGQLYASMDDAQKSIVKVHLASGTVIDLFTVGPTDIEEEGIAIFARPDGTLLHTLDVTSGRTSSELRHHTIAREPLRWKVCP